MTNTTLASDAPNTTTPKKHSLIASDRIEGTEVRRPQGNKSGGGKIGTIERLMIDKASGKVAYAVMTFGGFLGIGSRHLPIPWELLSYNTASDAYEIEIADELLRKAPAFEDNTDFDWGDRARELSVYDYYGLPPY